MLLIVLGVCSGGIVDILDSEYRAARQEEKRKMTDKIGKCSEGGEAEGWWDSPVP